MKYLRYKHWTVVEAFSTFMIVVAIVVNTMNTFIDKWEFIHIMNVMILLAVAYGYALSKTGSDQDIKEERR